MKKAVMAFFVSCFCFCSLFNAVSYGDELKVVLGNLNDRLKTKFMELEGKMQTASRDLSAKGMTGPSAREVLCGLCAADPNVIDCIIIDKSGEILVAEPEKYRSYEGTSVKYQAQIKEMLEKKKPVLTNLFEPIEGGNAVAFQYPIIGQDGEFCGSVSMLLDVYGLIKGMVSGQIKDKNCMVWVMQADGTIIYDPDPNQVNKNIFNDDLFRPFVSLIFFSREVAEKKEGTGSYEFYAAGLKDQEMTSKQAVWETFSFAGAEWRLVAVEIERFTTRDIVIKREVQTAISVLNTLNAKVESGEMTLDQAKKLGADIIRDMRYGDNNEGYFFVDTVEGVNVVLFGRKDVEGQNRYEAVMKGIYYVKEIINKAINGGGYTDYWFPKKGAEEPLRKRAYSLLFEPFGWVVGTGYYLED
ncbi:MAG TPA: cache domain-containing protein [Candidatus Omnitrophota bacterium]|nr:cache domain-containing protein [Candidatus Omnitrophota bacterium]HPS20985.1 cache domain-containing protein [Candidatus Omnitrophota bacterium]